MISRDGESLLRVKCIGRYLLAGSLISVAQSIFSNYGVVVPNMHIKIPLVVPPIFVPFQFLYDLPKESTAGPGSADDC
jgi:hypothetical protein